MKTILIIGIGAGDPDYITVQAAKALNRVDVFFLMDKGPAKQKLRALREALCRQHIKDRAYRFAEAESPPRDTAPADYRASVDALNREKQDVFERMIEGEMKDGETAGVLVWGDPMLYDSTIRNIEAIAAGGGHRNRIRGVSRHHCRAGARGTPQDPAQPHRRAGPAHHGPQAGRGISAGHRQRRRAARRRGHLQALRRCKTHGDMEIYWGAYLGTPDEILISGKLADVADEIQRRRAEARRANGWIMDTYLMRRPARTR